MDGIGTICSGNFLINFNTIIYGITIFLICLNCILIAYESKPKSFFMYLILFLTLILNFSNIYIIKNFLNQVITIEYKIDRSIMYVEK